MRYILLMLLFLPLAVQGATDPADPYSKYTEQDNGYNEALEVPWVEIETRVKGGPTDDDLSALEIESVPPGMTLYADLKNLTVDKRDYVTRLWLVLRSRSGVSNGTYEGFRCATGEYKVYAYHNPQASKPLRVVKLPKWRAIRGNSYRGELERLLCSDTNPRDPDGIRIRARRQVSDYVSPYDE